MNRWMTCLILILAAGELLWAIPNPSGEPIGLNIIFKSEVKFTGLTHEDFHKQLGFTLAYQSADLGFDFVLPKDKSQWSQNIAYERLCEKYMNLSMVRSCSVEYKKIKAKRTTFLGF